VLFLLAASLLGPVGPGMAQTFLSKKKPTPPAHPTSRWQNLDDYLNPTDTLRLVLIYEPAKQADSVAVSVASPATLTHDLLSKSASAIADSANTEKLIHNQLWRFIRPFIFLIPLRLWFDCFRRLTSRFRW
jgi:hypothetical protein